MNVPTVSHADLCAQLRIAADRLDALDDLLLDAWFDRNPNRKPEDDHALLASLGVGSDLRALADRMEVEGT